MSSVGTTFTCFNKIAKYVEYNYKNRTLKFEGVEKRNANSTISLSELDSKIEMEQIGVPVPKQGLATSLEELENSTEHGLSN